MVEDKANMSSDPKILIKLAGLYLDAGNEVLTDKGERLGAYEEGARVAKKALELEETNADAHFLYAANLGEAADLKGVAASFFGLDEMKGHVARAVQLDKDHAPALHMGAMILAELPRFMGGSPEVALTYMKRAVTSDPTYTHARLDLAKMYLKRGEQQLARDELLAIIGMENPRHPSAWSKRHRPEAEQLLRSIKH